MAEIVIWLLILGLGGLSAQKMEITNQETTGLCKGELINSINDLKQLEGCVVILGSLEIFIEKSEESDFKNLTFRDLREITEFLVIYRVRNLDSVGRLFPNLARIRGMNLLYNFALIVYDNGNLTEIGLYSLLKIDRGGVILWALPNACNLDTIDWEILAPRSRHVISPPEKDLECSPRCTCTRNTVYNRCWNMRKCQLYLEGPEADKCNEQCIGCRKTNKDSCFACRNYTYKRKCVSQCPPNTVIVPDSKYCITEEECHDIGRWVFNKTCVSHCPRDFKRVNNTNTSSCEPCTDCELTCGKLYINSLSSIQAAENCIYVNGSLTIHIQAIIDVIGDLKEYVSQIKEVSHYVAIYGSDFTSLDFLASLRLIKGEQLKNDTYSLDIINNQNLQSLFSPDVTKNLKINNGTARFDHNPLLCQEALDELIDKFPVRPTSIDIPEGSNGYGAACKENSIKFEVSKANESSVLIKFSPILNRNIQYTALYVRLPPGHSSIVPETCSELVWHAIDITTAFDKKYGIVELTTLQPASTYALCIEIYDPERSMLIRSNIFNFNTTVGIPEPPFIFKMVASSSDAVEVRWVNLEDYAHHIDYYELDVALIEMHTRSSVVIDYCTHKKDFFAVDYKRHELVRRLPPRYTKGCESKCVELISRPGVVIEDDFEVCDDASFGCHNQDGVNLSNSSYGDFVRTLILNISSPRNVFEVGGLAPFSDYRIRLRACSGGHCSRSSTGIVRTYRSKSADIPMITYTHADKSGHVFVNWSPPNVTNGPVLTYSIEIVPKVNVNKVVPKVWCTLAHQTKILVQALIAPEHLVRVCAETLAPSNTCSEWVTIVAVNESKTIMLWVGVTCGFFIYIASCVIGWFKRTIGVPIDVMPLVDSFSSSQMESEPPAAMLSDFVPFDTIHLD